MSWACGLDCKCKDFCKGSVELSLLSETQYEIYDYFLRESKLDRTNTTEPPNDTIRKKTVKPKIKNDNKLEWRTKI